MTDLLRSLILGVVQGLTEFLPISSSGHLELINHWLGSNESIDSDLLMIILVHFGTAKTQQWLLVRLDEPEGAEGSSEG